MGRVVAFLRHYLCVERDGFKPHCKNRCVCHLPCTDSQCCSAGRLLFTNKSRRSTVHGCLLRCGVFYRHSSVVLARGNEAKKKKKKCSLLACGRFCLALFSLSVKPSHFSCALHRQVLLHQTRSSTLSWQFVSLLNFADVMSSLNPTDARSWRVQFSDVGSSVTTDSAALVCELLRHHG